MVYENNNNNNKNFAKLTEKHMRWSLVFNTVATLGLQLYLKETDAAFFLGILRFF